MLGLLVALSAGAWGCKSQQPQAGPSSFAGNAAGRQKSAQPAAPVAPQATPAPSASPAQIAADDQGWSVYESKAGGFKISYPKTASLETPEPGKTEFTFVQPFAGGRDVLTFDVIIAEKPEGANLKDWALQQWGEGDAIKAEENTQLGGRDAYRLKIFESDQYSYHIYTAAGKKIYELTYVDAQSLAELSPDIQKQLADTFRKMAESFMLTAQP